MKKDFKIRIFQHRVPPYRVGLFRGVGARYPGRVEICATAQLDEFLKSSNVEGVHCDYAHTEKKVGPFVLMNGVSLKGLGRGDVIVIEGDVHRIAFMWVAVAAKLKGVRVVWWGLHRSPRQKKANEILRYWIMKYLATSILFYNRAGIAWLKSMGGGMSRAFAVGNAIDQEPIKRELAYWNSVRMHEFVLKYELGDKAVILACSKLSAKIRLHEALRAMAEDEMPSNVVLVVIGDGPLREELKRMSNELGLKDRVVWLGELFDQHAMAPWFLTAKLFVYPGPVGLGLLHSMAYGLPAVLNDTHNSTEVEAFVNGETGMMFREFDYKDLCRAICEMLKDEAKRRRMGESAQARVFKRYTMDMMVDNYCAAIDAAAREA